MNGCQTSQTFKIRAIIQNKTNERALYTKIYGQNLGSNFGLIYQTRKDAKRDRQTWGMIRGRYRRMINTAGFVIDGVNPVQTDNKQQRLPYRHSKGLPYKD